jgi:hypothetical protein
MPYDMNDMTYTTLLEFLDRCYGGGSLKDQQVVEELDKVKLLQDHDYD